MPVVLLNGIDELVISTGVTLPGSTSVSQVRKDLLHSLRNGTHGIPIAKSACFFGLKTTASYGDFDLHVEFPGSRRARVWCYLHQEALKRRPTEAWQLATEAGQAVADLLGGGSPTNGLRVSWCVTGLTLHADVANLRVGLKTIPRFVARGTDVRMLYARGDRLETIYTGVLRAYDKTAEIAQSARKNYVSEFWQGWNQRDPVWRLEFRLKTGDPALAYLPDLNAIWRECLKRVHLYKEDGKTPVPLWARLERLKFSSPWPDAAMPEVPPESYEDLDLTEADFEALQSMQGQEDPDAQLAVLCCEPPAEEVPPHAGT